MRLGDLDALAGKATFMYGFGENKYIPLKAVEQAPTITPESLVRHGKWEEVEDQDGDSHWRCSSCGIEWYFEADGPAENGCNYCPHCGAKMDLEE